MARFYKTAKPTFLDDIIYQPPWELMQETIKAHDSRINKGNEQANAYDLLMKEVNNIQDDDPAVNAAIESYRERMDTVTKGMQSDLPNYRKYIPEISSLKKELERDMENGVLGRATESFKEREKENARLDALKNVDAKKVASIKKYNDLRYTERGGLSFENKDKYNKYLETSINPEEVFDEAKFQNDLQSHFASNQTAYASAGPGGGYLWTKNGTTKEIDKKRVEEYMKNTPSMEKWRSTTRQDIMLDAYNKGVRGPLLDEYVEDELGQREKGFIASTAEMIGFIDETKNASVSVDSKHMADTKRANELEDRAKPIVDVKIETDRRTDAEKAQSDPILNKIKSMNGLNFDNSSNASIISALSEARKAGKLQNLLDDNGNFSDFRTIRDMLDSGDSIGERVNLVNIDPSVPMTPLNRQNYVKEVEALEHHLTNLDPSQPRKIVISSNYRKGSQLQESTIMDMLNRGLIPIANAKGSTGESTKEVINPPTYDADNNPIWRDTTGREIAMPDGKSYPKTEAEAQSAAAARGAKLATTKKVEYHKVLGNDVGVADAKVHRYQSASGNIDEFEIEVTTVRPGGGTEQIFEKAIIKVPASSVKAIAQ